MASALAVHTFCFFLTSQLSEPIKRHEFDIVQDAAKDRDISFQNCRGRRCPKEGTLRKSSQTAESATYAVASPCSAQTAESVTNVVASPGGGRPCSATILSSPREPTCPAALSRHVSVPSSPASVCVCVCVFCFKTMQATPPNKNPNTRDPPIVQRSAQQSSHPTSTTRITCQTQGSQRHKEKQNEPGEAKVLNPQDANKKKQTWGG